MAKYTNTEITEAREFLLGVLEPGTTVYTNLRHVSRSGMSRRLTVHVINAGDIRDITTDVACAAGFTTRNGELIVSGAGMDMGYHVVYSLSRSLFPDGHPCTNDRSCPSNDHSNDPGQARRAAVAELEDEGHDLDGDGISPARYDELRRMVSDRADAITERDGLTYRADRVHSDGGYALTQRWI